MELYLHSPNVFMKWCLIKQWICLHAMGLSQVQKQLYLYFDLYINFLFLKVTVNNAYEKI